MDLDFGPRRELERCRWWLPLWMEKLLVVAGVLALLVAVASQTATGSALLGLRRPAGTRAAISLPKVLDSGGLPATFDYGGVRWQAAKLVRLDANRELAPIGSLAEGYPVYYRRHSQPGFREELFLPAGLRRRPGTYVVYVRAVE